MQQHQSVIVHIDDSRLRRQPLGNLMAVVDGRQPSTDVQKLSNLGDRQLVQPRPFEKVAEALTSLTVTSSGRT
jgi:hypothetical protein